MKRAKINFVTVLMAGLLCFPMLSFANEHGEVVDEVNEYHDSYQAEPQEMYSSRASSNVAFDGKPGNHPRSYGALIAHKGLNGFANIATSWLEIPKNIINVTNQSNFVYGIPGGLFKGIANMVGRIATGVTDLVTFPIPTKPITQPLYVWDDFDVDTTYGDIFRLQED